MSGQQRADIPPSSRYWPDVGMFAEKVLGLIPDRDILNTF